MPNRAHGDAEEPFGALFGAPLGDESTADSERPYELLDPHELRSGVVFSSPHSGRRYFGDFLERSRLDPLRLRASEDAFIDMLFRPAVSFGAPLLAAVAPRAFLDLNRAATDLDPSLVDGAETRNTNARVIAGLGVIPRIVAEGVSIYSERIALAEAEARINAWHAPYHRQLAALLLRARRRFGRALLIDCHSMPSGAANFGGARRRGSGVDIVLGDRFGVASDAVFMDAIETRFQEEGFRVARNTPFAGGYITERFGRPAAGVSAVQIEIDRALYLDQTAIEPNAGYDGLASVLRRVIEDVCLLVGEPAAGSDEADDTPLAAE